MYSMLSCEIGSWIETYVTECGAQALAIGPKISIPAIHSIINDEHTLYHEKKMLLEVCRVYSVIYL